MHFPDQLTILQNKLSKPLSVRIKLSVLVPAMEHGETGAGDL